MLWLIPAWIISLVAAYFLGYHIAGIRKKVIELEEVIKLKVDKQPEVEEPKSTLIDPDDPVQQAKWERERMMERLNPK